MVTLRPIRPRITCVGTHGEGIDPSSNWHIETGRYRDVALDGLTMVGLILEPEKNVNAAVGRMVWAVRLRLEEPESRALPGVRRVDRRSGRRGGSRPAAARSRSHLHLRVAPGALRTQLGLVGGDAGKVISTGRRRLVGSEALAQGRDEMREVGRPAGERPHQLLGVIVLEAAAQHLHPGPEGRRAVAFRAAPPHRARTPRRSARRTNSSATRVFPTPGSPASRKSLPWPSSTGARPASSAASSRARPTNTLPTSDTSMG